MTFLIPMYKNFKVGEGEVVKCGLTLDKRLNLQCLVRAKNKNDHIIDARLPYLFVDCDKLRKTLRTKRKMLECFVIRRY